MNFLSRCRSWRARWMLAILPLVLVTAPLGSLDAGDEHFDPDTLFVFSVDNMMELKKGVEASQFGQFMKDPAIEALMERLKKMMTDVIENAIQEEMASTQPAEGAGTAEMADMMKQYMDCVLNNTTGRAAIGFGLRQGAGEKKRPDCIVHVQGGECFKELHERMLDTMLKADTSLVSAAMDIEGVPFRGIVPAGDDKLDESMENPDGVFFGSKDDNHYLILNESSFREYLQAAGTKAGGTSSKRLGDDPFYQQMVGQVGNGQIGMFVRLQPVWDLMGQVDDGEMMEILRACGVTEFDGVAIRYHFGERGVTGNSYIAARGRRGLLDLLPDSNASLTMPAFVPSNVLAASAMRLKLDRALEIITAVVASTAGDETAQGIQGQLAGIEQGFGVDVAGLLANLEGTLVILQFPRAQPTDGEDAMMFVPVQRYAFALRLKDPAPMENAIKTLVANPQFGDMFQVQDFLGKKLYVIEPDGDIDPEFAPPPGSVPTPGIAVDGDWLLISLFGDDLREMVRVAAGDESARLAALPEFQRLRGQVGSSGMGLGYQDYGEMVSQIVELLGPMLGAMGPGSNMMQLLEPGLLPDGALLEKYFGKSISVMHVNEDGSISAREWVPNRRYEPPARPAGESEEL